MENIVLLTIIAPSALEDALVDYLLSHELCRDFFYSRAIDMHGGDLTLQSLSERVYGRARRVEIRLPLPEADVPGLLEAFREAFPSSGAVCWTAPLTHYGRMA